MISKAAKEQGLIESTKIETITAEDVDNIMPHGSVVLATNARTKGVRAREQLGWEPTEISLAEEIPQMVKAEAELAKSQ